MICKKDYGNGKSSDNVSHPPHYAEGWSNGAEVIERAKEQ